MERIYDFFCKIPTFDERVTDILKVFPML